MDVFWGNLPTKMNIYLCYKIIKGTGSLRRTLSERGFLLPFKLLNKKTLFPLVPPF